MNTRRSFLKGFAAFVAAVSLAPELTFHQKLVPTEEAITAANAPFWFETTCASRCYSESYLKWRETVIAHDHMYA